MEVPAPKQRLQFVFNQKFQFCCNVHKMLPAFQFATSSFPTYSSFPLQQLLSSCLASVCQTMRSIALMTLVQAYPAFAPLFPLPYVYSQFQVLVQFNIGNYASFLVIAVHFLVWYFICLPPSSLSCVCFSCAANVAKNLICFEFST